LNWARGRLEGIGVGIGIGGVGASWRGLRKGDDSIEWEYKTRKWERGRINRETDGKEIIRKIEHARSLTHPRTEDDAPCGVDGSPSSKLLKVTGWVDTTF